MYTEQQVKEYSQVLSFFSSPELFKELKYSNSKLANEVANFNVAITLLETMEELSSGHETSPSYLELKDHLYKTIFKEQVSSFKLEEKLSDLLPKLQEDGLIEKMSLTDAGRKLVLIKKTIYYQLSLSSTILN